MYMHFEAGSCLLVILVARVPLFISLKTGIAAIAHSVFSCVFVKHTNAHICYIIYLLICMCL